MNDVKLGVFICACGDQIASSLDVDALVTGSQELPGVTKARRLAYSCSPDGLATIRAAIANEGLNRVLVAGCTPRTLEPRFRAACEEAGLNGAYFQLVDIREGCARVHLDEPELATLKALDLIRMGAARIALRQARQAVEAEVVPTALVIGGGVAGMTAALTLAGSDKPVKLVEREAALGGMLRDVHRSSPERREVAELVARKAQAVHDHPSIEVLSESEVTAISGAPGHYTIRIDGNGRQFDVGAIVVATGGVASQPWGRFRYDGKRVVTQAEFERALQGAEVPSNVVTILYAGQRDSSVSYRSDVCCMGALEQALAVKAANREAHVTVLFSELYFEDEAAGEKKLGEARRAGVEFVRYAPSSPPEVMAEAVEVHDERTGEDRRLSYDRVVLATPLVPQADASVVAHMLDLVQDENGFFPDVRYRLRPRNYVERGIYPCGAAHSPLNRIEAEFQATRAAFKAAHYLQAGQLTNLAPVASVDENLCTGCGTCVETCSFGAISMHARGANLDASQIDPLLCVGCGNCVVACPVKAISQPVDSDAEVLAQIDAALTTAGQNGRPRILVFGCEWSSHAAAEMAGARELSYPAETRLIRVRCSARFDPTHVLWALFSGADGVFLGACAPGECHYVDGNHHAQQRIDALRGLLEKSGFDGRRLRLEWIKPDDAQGYCHKINEFTNLIRALGPSPARM